MISEKETGKAYAKIVEDGSVFFNKKIGDTISLDSIGIQGYEAKITGGSDLQGFPMHPAVSSMGRKKIFSFQSVGFRQKIRGQRKRKNVRGNIVTKEIAQLNIVITKKGTQPLDSIVGKAEKKEELSAKEELIKKSMENVGNVDLAMDAKKIKGKAKG